MKVFKKKLVQRFSCVLCAVLFAIFSVFTLFDFSYRRGNSEMISASAEESTEESEVDYYYEVTVPAGTVFELVRGSFTGSSLDDYYLPFFSLSVNYSGTSWIHSNWTLGDDFYYLYRSGGEGFQSYKYCVNPKVLISYDSVTSFVFEDEWVFRFFNSYAFEFLPFSNDVAVLEPTLAKAVFFGFYLMYQDCYFTVDLAVTPLTCCRYSTVTFDSLNQFYANGYEQGTQDGYNEGYLAGYDEGFVAGDSEEKLQESFDNGYNSGYFDGLNYSTSSSSILSPDNIVSGTVYDSNLLAYDVTSVLKHPNFYLEVDGFFLCLGQFGLDLDVDSEVADFRSVKIILKEPMNLRLLNVVIRFDDCDYYINSLKFAGESGVRTFTPNYNGDYTSFINQSLSDTDFYCNEITFNYAPFPNAPGNIRLYEGAPAFNFVSTGYSELINASYNSGFDDGFRKGDESGYEIGYTDGENTGYQDGLADGEEIGYQNGLVDGEEIGYQNGLVDGESVGYDKGYEYGDNVGYNRGVQDAGEYTWFGLFTAVIDAPIMAFMGLLDFEILGMDMQKFFLSILTAALCIAVYRLFSGSAS